MAEYKIFEPGLLDEALFRAVCTEYRLDAEGSASMLPYGDKQKVGWETRRVQDGTCAQVGNVRACRCVSLRDGRRLGLSTYPQHHLTKLGSP